jgi:hypothetical protein
MGKPGYFARLASIIMKDVKEEKGLVISWDSGKELAREFVEFKSFDLDNLGNKTIKTKTKTKAKVAKASPVVGNQDYDIMLNKRINDNKNNLSMLNSQLQAKLNKADQLDKDMNKGRVKREFKSPKPDMVVIERIPPIKQFIMGTGFLYSLYLIDTLVNFYLTR